MLETISYVGAIRAAHEVILNENKNSILIGEGVPDPKAIFNTTGRLKELFPNQVYDMPVSEAGLTGVCIGLAIGGLRPIMIHQRIDFALYAMDQIVNNAAKWHSMYGGKSNVSMVIRMIIGRGWGQGHQHSQNLSGLFAGIPGLKVVMPSNPSNGASLLIESFKDKNPVMFIEHRWIHGVSMLSSNMKNNSLIGKAEIVRVGVDITLVSWSYMLYETLKAVEFLETCGVICEVIDLLSIRPMDLQTIRTSAEKTGRLLIVEEAWEFNSISGEIMAKACDFNLKSRPQRINCPDFYVPSSHGLAKTYYPGPKKIFNKVKEMLNINISDLEVSSYEETRIHDIPDANFKGPF